jgi:hypothetical protein
MCNRIILFGAIKKSSSLTAVRAELHPRRAPFASEFFLEGREFESNFRVKIYFVSKKTNVKKRTSQLVGTRRRFDGVDNRKREFTFGQIIRVGLLVGILLQYKICVVVTEK